MRSRRCYPPPCLPQDLSPPQPPRFTPPPNLRPPTLIAPSRHRFTLAPLRKNAILSFQHLTHSSQFAIPPIPRILLALQTLCQKHPGVGLDLAFSIHSL